MEWRDLPTFLQIKTKGIVESMSSLSFSRIRGFLFALALPAFAGSSVPGIKNFYQVDAHVYRGAQPTDEGFKYLAKIGVGTVIDLRETDERSRAEERVVRAAGMKYVNIPMTGLTPPTEAEITRILGLFEDKAAGPVFVHCRRGADRTGVVIASYRINHDRWDNARALSEAKKCGMSFFQFPRQSYILAFAPRTSDVKTARAAAATASGSGAVTVDRPGELSAPLAAR
jgi:tyrosine-protein phosphatase SIW14